MPKHNHRQAIAVTIPWLPSILVLILSASSGVARAGAGDEGGCSPPDNASLDPTVPLKPQETDYWCWAASGQMTMNYLHSPSNVQQCDEANQRFGRSDCCNSPVPEACVNGAFPPFRKYHFTAKHTSDQELSWDKIKKQIYCAKKPFAFSWHWDKGGGHMMVATGYQTVDGVPHVEVNNPWVDKDHPFGSYEIYTYKQYVGGATYSHWNDYYNITYQGE